MGDRVRLSDRAVIDRVLAEGTWRRVFLPRFELPESALADSGVTEKYRAELDKAVDACGCGEGAAASLAAFGGYLIYGLLYGPAVGIWGMTWRSLSALFVGATLGKVWGLMRARMELKRLLVRLRPLLPAATQVVGLDGSPAAVPTLRARPIEVL